VLQQLLGMHGLTAAKQLVAERCTLATVSRWRAINMCPLSGSQLTDEALHASWQTSFSQQQQRHYVIGASYAKTSGYFHSPA
jgi:hypothetical protein